VRATVCLPTYNERENLEPMLAALGEVLREGDRVLFAKYGGTEFKLDGEEYLVLKENDILAVIG